MVKNMARISTILSNPLICRFCDAEVRSRCGLRSIAVERLLCYIIDHSEAERHNVANSRVCRGAGTNTTIITNTSICCSSQIISLCVGTVIIEPIINHNVLAIRTRLCAHSPLHIADFHDSAIGRAGKCCLTAKPRCRKIACVAIVTKGCTYLLA